MKFVLISLISVILFFFVTSGHSQSQSRLKARKVFDGLLEIHLPKESKLVSRNKALWGRSPGIEVMDSVAFFSKDILIRIYHLDYEIPDTRLDTVFWFIEDLLNGSSMEKFVSSSRNQDISGNIFFIKRKSNGFKNSFYNTRFFTVLNQKLIFGTIKCSSRHWNNSKVFLINDILQSVRVVNPDKTRLKLGD